MIRFQNEERKLLAGVHDLLDAGPPKGDLYMQVAWSQKRMRGQQSYTIPDHNTNRQSFEREVKNSHRILVPNQEVIISEI